MPPQTSSLRSAASRASAALGQEPAGTEALVSSVQLLNHERKVVSKNAQGNVIAMISSPGARK